MQIIYILEMLKFTPTVNLLGGGNIFLSYCMYTVEMNLGRQKYLQQND
jgi:hypothetical protein